MSSVVGKVIFSIAFTAFGFVLAQMSEPVTGEIGLSIKNYWIKNKGISIRAYAPLTDASRIFRAFDPESGEDYLLERANANVLNVVHIKVENMTNENLTNVVVSVVPIFDGEQYQSEFFRITAATNAVEARKDYEMYERADRRIQTISTKTMASGDGVFYSGYLHQPLDLQIELKSDQHTVRKTFPRGCDLDEVLEEEASWNGFYFRSEGYCEDSEDVLTCREEWEVPDEFVKLMQDGAFVEVTQIVNREVRFVTVLSATAVSRDGPPEEYIINTERQEFFNNTREGS